MSAFCRTEATHGFDVRANGKNRAIVSMRPDFFEKILRRGAKKDAVMPGVWKQVPLETKKAGMRPALMFVVQRHYRIFRVAKPIIARMSEMIQKRITICGSFQPFFS